MSKENLAMPLIRITHDEMEAFITLPARQEADAYTLPEVMDAISKAGVRFGVDQNVLLEMVQSRLYSHEMRFATGRPVVHGSDGSYHYYFSNQFDTKPSLRADGSVDYWNIHTIETVEEGQIIAKYAEPIEGKDGMSVKGKLQIAKRGKPQLPLVGRGFEVMADGVTYQATVSGKIERNANRITIAPVYELFGDASVQTGNIEFRGDVVIHGCVRPGIKIKATGSVTIDGTAEQCIIEAGRDIVLRGGLLGGQKASLNSKGNIFAKFFEYANVEAGGFIEADSSLNSYLVSYDKVFMNGRHATIVGGSVYGVRGIEANSIGNISELKTEVYAGVRRDILQRMNTLEYMLNEAESIVQKITKGINQFDELARAKGLDGRKDQRRIALMRTKVVKQAELSADKDEYMRLKDIADRGTGASVRVLHECYGGVNVTIDDTCKVMKDEEESIEFFQRNGSVVMLSIKDQLA